MKIENAIALILIIVAGTAVAYFAISNWWSHTDATTFQKTPYYDLTNSTNDASLIDLSLTTNSTLIKQGQVISIDLRLSNTSNKTLIANYNNNLISNGFELTPCDVETPFGIKILQGNYGENNMTQGKSLSLYHPGIYHCPVEFNIKSYDFEPLSDKALFETIGGINNSFEMNRHLSFGGYYDGDTFQPFSSGKYTIIGSDEWGHVIITHFTVTHSTSNSGYHRFYSATTPQLEYVLKQGQTLTIPVNIYYTERNAVHLTSFTHIHYCGPEEIQIQSQSANSSYAVPKGCNLDPGDAFPDPSDMTAVIDKKSIDLPASTTNETTVRYTTSLIVSSLQDARMGVYRVTIGLTDDNEFHGGSMVYFKIN